MALILTIGFGIQYKVESMQDAQMLMDIFGRATPVDSVSHKHSDKFREKYGNSFFACPAVRNEIEIKMVNGEPATEKEYQKLMEQLEAEAEVQEVQQEAA
ncbi:MAG TPA: hypothetical protein DCW59_04950 [Alteromonas sp.]|nr:hypothetical protein [Alteromonas sp.]|tara:strand:+ start:430 stop:729 length:300 start_codon:yes stop_codon:yes gene_type:complete